MFFPTLIVWLKQIGSGERILGSVTEFSCLKLLKSVSIRTQVRDRQVKTCEFLLLESNITLFNSLSKLGFPHSVTSVHQYINVVLPGSAAEFNVLLAKHGGDYYDVRCSHSCFVGNCQRPGTEEMLYTTPVFRANDRLVNRQLRQICE